MKIHLQSKNQFNDTFDSIKWTLLKARIVKKYSIVDFKTNFTSILACVSYLVASFVNRWKFKLVAKLQGTFWDHPGTVDNHGGSVRPENELPHKLRHRQPRRPSEAFCKSRYKFLEARGEKFATAPRTGLRFSPTWLLMSWGATPLRTPFTWLFSTECMIRPAKSFRWILLGRAIFKKWRGWCCRRFSVGSRQPIKLTKGQVGFRFPSFLRGRNKMSRKYFLWVLLTDREPRRYVSRRFAYRPIRRPLFEVEMKTPSWSTRTSGGAT